MRSTEYRSLGDVLRVNARLAPAAVAIVFDGREITFSTLDKRSNRVARALLERGFEPGNPICVLSKNCVEYIEILFGAAKAGLVFTPLNWRLLRPELGYITSDSEARLIFCSHEFRGMAHSLSEELQLDCIVFGGDAEHGLDYESWISNHPDADVNSAVDGQDVALLMYTSGTTGRPKGAMLTHENLSINCDLDNYPTPAGWQVRRSDVQLVASPTFHIGGLQLVLRSLFSGSRVILHPEFDPARMLEDIERYQVTITGLVPTALQILLRHPRAAVADLRSLQVFQYGASPMPAALLEEARSLLRCGLCQQYGMTETSAAITVLSPADHESGANARWSSAGRPLPFVLVRILDAAGNALGPNERGEVAVKSRGNMKGYWHRPEATSEAIDPDGWLRSGDVGYLDPDGYLHISDRVKDMIVTGAENVYPAEVENGIYSHPGVSEVCVIGVPDEKWGESVKAVIVPRPGQTLSEAQIIQWARTHMASYKAPRSVDFVDALPKNAAGKVLKTEVRKRYWVGRDRAII